MTHATELDVLIVGGGPAGAAAAIELARSGRRVTLVERSLTPHDKVCGDFLSGEAAADLLALGVCPQALGAASIHRVRLCGPLGISTADLPFAAQSLTRRALDEALLQRAAAIGAVVLRGHTVQGISREDQFLRADIVSPNSSYSLHARDIILATGKHDLRGLPRPDGVHTGLVGLKMYLRLAPGQSAALQDTIELALLRGGYGGLSLVERSPDSGENPRAANLCFVVDRASVRSLGSSWESLATWLREHPHLRRRLAAAEPLLPRPLAISPIPYGFVRREAIAPALWAVGDQAAVIPSFTGDGIALALHSGRLAAHAMLSGLSAEEFQREFHTQVERQVARATMLSRALTSQPQRAFLEAAAHLFPRSMTLIAHTTRLAPRFRIHAPENSHVPA